MEVLELAKEKRRKGSVQRCNKVEALALINGRVVPGGITIEFA